MKKIIIPTSLKKGRIESALFSPSTFLGTTAGLVKETNEDCLGCFLDEEGERACIADGHWGNKAAEVIVHHWMTTGIVFPTNKQQAISEVIKIEQKLFELFGKTTMDPQLDLTPEAGFVAAQLKDSSLKIVSYGDCRLLVAREGKVHFTLLTRETWLGAFSQLGLRDRLPINQALIFEHITLQENDVVLIFSDGVDQCVYEHNTLSDEFLANLTSQETAEKCFKSILNAVWAAGAEDNASLVVLKK